MNTTVSSRSVADGASGAANLAGITVLVCGYNSAQRLPATLSALAGLAQPAGFAVEVLVVDNASTDETTAVAHRTLAELKPFFPYQVLQEPRPGKSHALAQGFARARYRYVCIVDDDNWLAPNYLNLAWEIMEAHPATGVVGGVGEPQCEITPPAWFSKFALDYAAAPQAPRSGDITLGPGSLYGAGSVVRRSAWAHVHEAGFHSLLTGRHGNSLSSGEDNELCYAFALAGYRIWYDERLRFQHFIPRQRLSWEYVRRLHKGNAESEVSLRPYRHFLEQASIPKLVWLRNGLYAGRYALQASWSAISKGHFYPREGNREFLLAAYYWRVVWLYIRKEWQRDPKFTLVQNLIARLQSTFHLS